jgi:hypothetical protein
MSTKRAIKTAFKKVRHRFPDMEAFPEPRCRSGWNGRRIGGANLKRWFRESIASYIITEENHGGFKIIFAARPPSARVNPG